MEIKESVKIYVIDFYTHSVKGKSNAVPLFIKHHAMKIYEVVEISLYAFLTSAIAGDE
jgi:hypothetical protein